MQQIKPETENSDFQLSPRDIKNEVNPLKKQQNTIFFWLKGTQTIFQKISQESKFKTNDNSFNTANSPNIQKECKKEENFEEKKNCFFQLKLKDTKKNNFSKANLRENWGQGLIKKLEKKVEKEEKKKAKVRFNNKVIVRLIPKV